MLDAKPVSTPMEASTQLSITMGTPLDDPFPYISTIGALQYVLLTRPDLSFVVNKLCQFLHAPANVHWSAVKRVLRYLCETVNLGLAFIPSQLTQLSAYMDVDWTGFPDDRRNTGSFSIYLGANLVSWASNKQQTVARSSTESEYPAVVDAIVEITWLRSLLFELGSPHIAPTILWCDNIGSTWLPIPFFIHGQSMWRLVFTLYGKWYGGDISKFDIYLQRIILPTH